MVQSQQSGLLFCITRLSFLLLLDNLGFLFWVSSKFQEFSVSIGSVIVPESGLRSSIKTGKKNWCPCGQQVSKCSMGPSVDSKQARPRTSACRPHPGAGHLTNCMFSCWKPPEV